MRRDYLVTIEIDDEDLKKYGPTMPNLSDDEDTLWIVDVEEAEHLLDSTLRQGLSHTQAALADFETLHIRSGPVVVKSEDDETVTIE